MYFEKEVQPSPLGIYFMQHKLNHFCIAFYPGNMTSSGFHHSNLDTNVNDEYTNIELEAWK
jgi:hypothetical protein